MHATQKSTPVWICTDCGEETLKWGGRCLNCGAWNTLKEVRLATSGSHRSRALKEKPQVYDLAAATLGPVPDRIATGLSEVDRVLGGGIFHGPFGWRAGNW